MSDVLRSTTWLADAAVRDPGRIALRDVTGASLSYGELWARAATLAPALAGTDGPIGLELEPGLEHAVALHAAILARRPALTIRTGLPPAERAAVIAAGAPARILDETTLAELLGGEAADPGNAPRPGASLPGPVPAGPPAPSDALARVLSSGTTGARRPVDLSFANFASSAASSAANLGVEPGDLWLGCLPVDHVGGLSILTRSAIYGTTALLHPDFDVDAVAAALAARSPRVTLISLVPTQLRRLLDAGAELAHLRVALIGGAALDPETLERALTAGAPVVQSYGLTEACSQVCTLAPDEAAAHRGSSGRALPGIEVEIEAGGTIRIRGDNVAVAATDAAGWLRTGDLGRLDPDGYLWVEGRADDVIVSGGENVRPEPVEEILRGFPAVLDAAVIGRPDPEWGQAVTALVVPGPGAEPDAGALIAHCRSSLAPAMVPKAVEFVDDLPYTASGKLQRARLRERADRA